MDKLYAEIHVAAMRKLKLNALEFIDLMNKFPAYSQFFMQIREHDNGEKTYIVEELVETLIMELEIFGLLEEE